MVCSSESQAVHRLGLQATRLRPRVAPLTTTIKDLKYTTLNWCTKYQSPSKGLYPYSVKQIVIENSVTLSA